jgi:hypothetical protein
MNLADVFTFLFIILGFVIAFVSYWLLSAGLFPHLVERAAERLGATPVKATLLGAIVTAPLVITGLVVSNKAPNGGLKLAGLVIALIPLLLGLLGSAGIALRIGIGLRSSCDAVDPWRRVLRGSVVLGLSFILPVIGWFGVLPLTLVSGFGAFLLAAFSRKSAAVASVPGTTTPAPAFGPAQVIGLSPGGEIPAAASASVLHAAS